MAARTSWEGYLRLNLLSIPVKAYSATVSGGGKISFHQIHQTCHSRIHYKKVCPIHGEVPKEEIVPGYGIARGKYVLVDPEELHKLLPENEKTLNIDVFIRPKDLDPVYYAGKAYYLVPDGRVADKPYAVLQHVMAEQDRLAVGQLVMAGREHVVLVRSVDKLLAMMLLNYEEQIKKPTSFADEAPEVSMGEEELKLAETLVEASTAEHFDFGQYHDEYTAKVAKLLEAKAAGKKIAPAKSEEEPAVINLMDALRKSLDRAKRHPPGKEEGARKPKRKSATSHKRRAARRRKTG